MLNMEINNSEQNKFNVKILTQYIKSVSFENSGAPFNIYQKQAPRIDLSVNVDVSKLNDKEFEVVLKLMAQAKNPESEDLVFSVNTSYGGVFDLSEIPEEAQKNILLVYCPNLLFPFARAVVANNVRDAGFPPLMINPIDFTGLTAAN